MKRVLTAVVLIPLVVVMVFKAHPAFLLLVVGGVSYFCAREFVEIAKGHGLRPLKLLLFTFVLLPYLVPFLMSFTHEGLREIATPFFLTLVVFSPFVFLASAMFRRNMNEALPSAAMSLFGFLYIGVGLFSVWYLSVWRDYGTLFVLCLLLIVWSGDISAYYVGTYLGRRKLAPRISPNKTWEGAIASFAIATGIASVILVNFDPVFRWLFTLGLASLPEPSIHLPVFPSWFCLSASAIINIAAQLGDLMESAMKRGANLKDSGTILPGHGGMLDRIDALLFAGPVAMLLFVAGEMSF